MTGFGVRYGSAGAAPVVVPVSEDLAADYVAVSFAAAAAVSRRGRLQLPEADVALGPLAEGVVGGGRFGDLYGYPWGVVYDRQRGELRLFRIVNGAWSETSLITALPAPQRHARHVALAFDQNARAVVSWEVDGALWVFRWAGAAYAVEGPYEGCDPCLVCDALAHFDPTTSDVLLYHLSSDRRSLVARVQSENYGTPHAVHDFPVEVYLDQITATPYRVQVFAGDRDGRLSAAAGGDGQILNSELYPVGVSDDVLAAAVPRNGRYDPSVLYGGTTELAPAATGAALNGSYAPSANYVSALEAAPSGAAAPRNGAYAASVTTIAPAAAPVNAGAAARPGVYALGAINATRVEPSLNAAAVPRNGSYSL